MQRLLETKRRMATIRNIQVVTRTLATVSSAKLSRARGRAAGMRMYAGRAREALHRQQGDLARSGEDLAALSPYLVTPAEVSKVLVLHLSADRGMCGNYNMAVNRRALKLVQYQTGANHAVDIVCKGIKGERYFRRRGIAPIVHAEPWSRAGVTDEDIDRLFALVTEPFLSGEIQEVYATFTEFHSPLHRVPLAMKLLPLHGGAHVRSTQTHRWAYEPDSAGVLTELVEMFVRCQLEDVLLQSYASEQGARMITMEEATERAAVSLHDCQLLYNRLRREVITTDLLGVLFASRLREEESATAREGA